MLRFSAALAVLLAFGGAAAFAPTPPRRRRPPPRRTVTAMARALDWYHRLADGRDRSFAAESKDGRDARSGHRLRGPSQARGARRSGLVRAEASDRPGGRHDVRVRPHVQGRLATALHVYVLSERQDRRSPIRAGAIGGPAMANPRIVLFDLDDTLHDDTFAYRSATEEVAREIETEHGVDALALKAAYEAEAEGFWHRLSAEQSQVQAGVGCACRCGRRARPRRSGRRRTWPNAAPIATTHIARSTSRRFPARSICCAACAQPVDAWAW